MEATWGIGYYLVNTEDQNLAAALGGPEISVAADINAAGVPVEAEVEVGLGDNGRPNSIMFKTGFASKAWNLAPVTFQAGASNAIDAKPILTTDGFWK